MRDHDACARRHRLFCTFIYGSWLFPPTLIVLGKEKNRADSLENRNKVGNAVCHCLCLARTERCWLGFVSERFMEGKKEALRRSYIAIA